MILKLRAIAVLKVKSVDKMKILIVLAFCIGAAASLPTCKMESRICLEKHYIGCHCLKTPDCRKISHSKMMKMIQNANDLILNKLYSVANITMKLCSWSSNLTKERSSFDVNQKMGFHCNPILEDDEEKMCAINLLEETHLSMTFKYDFPETSEWKLWGVVIILFIAKIFLCACCKKSCPNNNLAVSVLNYLIIVNNNIHIFYVIKDIDDTQDLTHDNRVEFDNIS